MSRNVCRVIGCVVVGWMAIVSSSIAQAVTVLSMPDNAQGDPGTIVQVPISAAPGDGIFGIDMTVQYDPAVLEAQNVTVSGIAATAGFSLIRNLNTPGTIIISMFAPGDPLAGSGAIAQIQFNVLGARGTTSPLTFTSAVANEGGIQISVDNGLFTVPTLGALLSMPDDAQGSPGAIVQVPISVTPGDGIFGIDMTVQYDPAVLEAQNVTVSGIAATAGFSLVRNLNTPGTIIISMFAPGDPLAGSGAIAQIQFHVLGSAGTSSALTFQTASINEGGIPASFDHGLFTVPSIGAVLTMPDTAQGGPAAVVQVPVSVTPGTGILGVDLTITYDPAVLLAQNVTVSGIGAAANFAVVRNLNTPGVIILSTYAQGDLLSGSGEFLQIQFLVVGTPSTTSNLTFASASINEGAIPATIDNGLFTVTCAGVVDGTACDDGNACTQADTCQAGVCVGANPVVCLADECNNAGTCNPSTGLCSAPTPKANGTSCGDAGSACVNQDTCVAGVCQDNGFAASGTACGTQGVACQNNDACDGAGTCTDNGNVADGTACGSNVDTECSNPDTCLAGACNPNDEAIGVACGTQGVACQVNDTCNGAGACTDNGNVADGTACGSNADTECSNPDTCLAGACNPNDELIGFACGTQGVACQVNDTCNGAGACTDNGNATDGSACGSNVDTECSNPDTCLAGACNLNNEAIGFACGTQGVACQNNDACDGAGTCTDNGNVADGTACGSNVDTDCSNPDT